MEQTLIPNKNLFQAPSITKCGIYNVQFFTLIDKPFLLILEHFQNAYLTLN